MNVDNTGHLDERDDIPLPAVPLVQSTIRGLNTCPTIETCTCDIHPMRDA